MSENFAVFIPKSENFINKIDFEIQTNLTKFLVKNFSGEKKNP